MPTYEYECTKCGAITELFQSIKEPARRKLRKTDPHACDCNAPVQRRIGTGGGIIFRGSGFYQTDYRSKSYKDAAKAETDGTAKPKSAAEKDAKSGSGGKSDTAPSPQKPKASDKRGAD